MNIQGGSLSDLIQECLHLLNKYNYLCGKIQELSTQKNKSYYVNCAEAYHCYRYCRTLILERAVKMDDFEYFNGTIVNIPKNIKRNPSLISIYIRLKSLLLVDIRIEWITFEFYFYAYCNFIKNNSYLRNLLSYSWISMHSLDNILNLKNTLNLVIEITGNQEDSTVGSIICERNYIRMPSKFININETIEQLYANLEHSLEFLISDFILFKERCNFDYIILITTDDTNIIDNKIPNTINFNGNVIKMLNLFEKIAKNLTKRKKLGDYAHLYLSIIEISKWKNILSVIRTNNDNKMIKKSKYFNSAASTHNTNDSIITIGIHNQNNSCYINCIIQSLIGTDDFFNWILAFNANNELHNSSKQLFVTNGLKNLFKDIHDCNKVKTNRIINIESFKYTCGISCRQFQGNAQQDCVEFCNFLLDSLNTELKAMSPIPNSFVNKEMSPYNMNWQKYLSENDTIITQLFVGQVNSRLKCRICHTLSVNYETFSILSLPIPNVVTCNIMECFRQFFEEQQLDPPNQWNCVKCGVKTPSTQKITLIKMPTILIIQLARFDNSLIRNNCFIHYPLILDYQYTGVLTNPYTNDVKYELYSVVCHQGSVNKGHYSTFVYKGDKNGWYYFNDTIFKSIQTLNEIIRSDAYLLFYRRVK